MIRYCLAKNVVNGSSSGSWQPEARSYFSEEEGLLASSCWLQADARNDTLLLNKKRY